MRTSHSLKNNKKTNHARNVILLAYTDKEKNKETRASDDWLHRISNGKQDEEEIGRASCRERVCSTV